MAGNTFQGRQIEIIDFGDISVDQRVFEFTDPAIPERGSHFAIAVPDPDEGTGAWTDIYVLRKELTQRQYGGGPTQA